MKRGLKIIPTHKDGQRWLPQIGQQVMVLMDGSTGEVLDTTALMSEDDRTFVANAVKVRLSDGMEARFLDTELKPMK